MVIITQINIIVVIIIVYKYEQIVKKAHFGVFLSIFDKEKGILSKKAVKKEGKIDKKSSKLCIVYIMGVVKCAKFYEIHI